MRTSRTGERRSTSSAGFTLLELLVVIAILAAVATVAVPFFSGLAGPRLEAEAEMLSDALRDARARAMRESREVVVAFDTGAGTIFEPGRQALVQFAPGTEFELVSAATERIAPETGAVRFLPDGSSTGAALTLGRDKRRVMLEVDWFDGSVEIRRGGPF